jgi:carbon storage regulator CsrA
MLVLRRKAGQSVVTSHGLRVRVIAIEGKRVRLGFEAPEGVRVWRNELVDNGARQDICQECFDNPCTCVTTC